LELIALICRYHRKAEPSLKHRDFEILEPGDRDLVRRLAGLLRVGDGLDRSHTQRTTGVHVRFGGSSVTIEAESSGDNQTDLAAARAKSGLLADVLGMEVEVAAAAPKP
jgi:exopolyphosphatase/guanosine-5'-triphosphate,3'-diphosphate pyrophosphatase